MDEFRYIFENSDIEVICVSETWFCPEMFDSIFKLNGYQLFRNDREAHAGGVAIYVKENMSCRILTKSKQIGTTEFLFLEINSNYEKLLVECVYRNLKTTDYSNFIEAFM